MRGAKLVRMLSRFSVSIRFNAATGTRVETETENVREAETLAGAELRQSYNQSWFKFGKMGWEMVKSGRRSAFSSPRGLLGLHYKRSVHTAS